MVNIWDLIFLICNYEVDQCSKFVLGVSKCQGFYQGLSMFFSISLGKKMLRQLNYLES